jgi:hypothetical protein
MGRSHCVVNTRALIDRTCHSCVCVCVVDGQVKTCPSVTRCELREIIHSCIMLLAEGYKIYGEQFLSCASSRGVHEKVGACVKSRTVVCSESTLSHRGISQTLATGEIFGHNSLQSAGPSLCCPHPRAAVVAYTVSSGVMLLKETIFRTGVYSLFTTSNTNTSILNTVGIDREMVESGHDVFGTGASTSMA